MLLPAVAQDHLIRKLLSQTTDFCEFVYLVLTLYVPDRGIPHRSMTSYPRLEVFCARIQVGLETMVCDQPPPVYRLQIF